MLQNAHIEHIFSIILPGVGLRPPGEPRVGHKGQNSTKNHDMFLLEIAISSSKNRDIYYY